MNKILVVTTNAKERANIEEILYELVNGGVELFMASTKEHAIEILKREVPQLIFVDVAFMSEDEDVWTQNEAHIVLMRKKDEAMQASEDYLIKPIQADQMIEKCYHLLNLSQKSGPTLPL